MTLKQETEADGAKPAICQNLTVDVSDSQASKLPACSKPFDFGLTSEHLSRPDAQQQARLAGTPPGVVVLTLALSAK